MCVLNQQSWHSLLLCQLSCLESSCIDPCLFNQENPALERYSDNELRVCYKYVSVSLFTYVFTFHNIWILDKALARICFPCCRARFCCMYLIGFRQLLLEPIRQCISCLSGLKHSSSCWFILPMGRLNKLRVWLQQVPSWVCFEKWQGSSVTEGEKMRFKKLVY